MIKNARENWRRGVLCVLIVILPGVFLYAYKTGIESMNGRYYGLRTTNDRTDTVFTDVMKRLYSIEDPENDDPDTWVSRRSLQRAIEVSPTLASISEDLMNRRDGWAHGEDVELKGDLIGWILRATTDVMGHYTTAEATDAFYRKISDELEAGFADGRLKREDAIYLSSQANGFHVDDFLESLTMTVKAAASVLWYNECDIRLDQVNREIDGEEYQIQQAEYLLDSTLNRSDAQMAQAQKEPELYDINEMVKANRIRVAEVSNLITRLYRVFGSVAWACIIAGCIFLIVRRNAGLRGFVKENAIWMIGTFLVSVLNIYMVALFSRWLSRDPTGNLVDYYAPSAYALFELIKLGLLSYILLAVSEELSTLKRGQSTTWGRAA